MFSVKEGMRIYEKVLKELCTIRIFSDWIAFSWVN